MRKGKKIVAAMLAVFMVMTSLAGCGEEAEAPVSDQPESRTEQSSSTGGAESESSEAFAEQPESQEIAVDAFAGETLKIAVFKHSLDMGDKYADKLAIVKAAEATGINIEFIEVEAGTESDRVTAMLTSDMPDVMLGLLSESKVVQNADLFYDLSQENLLETYAPAVLADINSMEGGLELMRLPDGSVRSLPTGPQVSYSNDADGIMVINKAWLDKLNLPIPSTADEFYATMKAFKENDMTGNGDTEDEIPLEFSKSNWAAQIMNLANPWGIAGRNQHNDSHYFMVKDGKAVPTMDTEEFRAFLEFHHKLASEGLLDVRGFDQANDEYYAKLKEGRVGCYLAWTPNSNFDAEIAKNWVVVPPFKAMDGVEPVKTGQRNRIQANMFGISFSAECKNIEAALTWWNYLSSTTEMKWLCRRGEEGVSWEVDEAGGIHMKVPEGVTTEFTEQNYQYTYGMVDRAPFIRKDELAVPTEDPEDTGYIRRQMVNQVWDMLQTEYIPDRIVDGDAVSERTFIEADLFTVIDNFVSTSIVEGIDDAKWEAYLSQLEAAGYYDWIAWYDEHLLK